MSRHRGGGGEAGHVLHSHICGLDFRTVPPFDYADNDPGDPAFVKATKFIKGRYSVEEYLACSMYPFSARVSFEGVADGVSPVSRLKLPLPKFEVVRKDDEDDVQFLARVELDAEGVVGSYTRLEHDVCVTSLRDGGCPNRVFELAGVAYKSHPVPGTDAFTEASKKRKMDAAGKSPVVKRVKAPRKKKGGTHECCCTSGENWLDATYRSGGGFGETSEEE
jgi:hypothetical protein